MVIFVVKIVTLSNCYSYLMTAKPSIMASEIINERQKRLARYAKAMGHPIRIYILELLQNQTCCYSGDLSEELPIAKSTLSQHLKELKRVGLIQGEIEAPKIRYCLHPGNWEEAKNLFSDFLEK